MRVILVRHAIAVERGTGWADAERPLTLEGVQRLEKSVAGMARAGLSLDGLLTSPWTRAVETAERVAELLVQGAPIETELLADEPTEALLEALASGESVGAVGHEPWMSELCAWLCTGDPELASVFPFKKAGVAVLEGEAPRPGEMELKAFLPPRMLRRLAPQR